MNNTENQNEKDSVLEGLEDMLAKLPEDRRQPILDLIKKRKIELGLLKSELPVAGYRMKKKHPKETGAVPVPGNNSKRKIIPGKNREAIRRIAETVGRISETRSVTTNDIDIKDEPLKKDKKVLEEVDSYKY